MGVTDLWPILEPVRTHVPLTALAGQVVAVDLSVWIVSSQTVTKMMGSVSKPHLRNLFFRVSHLLQNDVLPVFVVDGDAPEVKWNTIAERCRAKQQHQQKISGGRTAQADHGLAKKPKRPQLTAAIRECCELLDYLGIPYVRAEGEAEALCAALNQRKLVDSVITDDGDAFLYGATTVYRNFTITKEPSVDSYNMADVETVLKLSREKLVALALLVGCDYDVQGVPGVGKSQAVQLLTAMPGGQAVISRFRQWSTISPVELLPYERSVAAKAMELKEFPNEKVISEFFAERSLAKFRRNKFCWQAPHLSRLQTFLKEKLEWPAAYSAGKCVPLLTLWQMTRTVPTSEVAALSTEQLIRPLRIIKKRIRNGVSCAEVEWQKPENLLIEDATSDDAPPIDEAGVGDAAAVVSASSATVITVEKLKLLERCYLQLVDEFETLVTLKRTSKSRARKQGQAKAKGTGTEAAGDAPARKSSPKHERGGLRENADRAEVLRDITRRMNCLDMSAAAVPSIFTRREALVGATVACAESEKARWRFAPASNNTGPSPFARTSADCSATYDVQQDERAASRYQAPVLDPRPRAPGSSAELALSSSSGRLGFDSEKPQRPAAAAVRSNSMSKVDTWWPCDGRSPSLPGDCRSRNADGVYSLACGDDASPCVSGSTRTGQSGCRELDDEGNDSVELFDLQPAAAAAPLTPPLLTAPADNVLPSCGELSIRAASGLGSKVACSAPPSAAMLVAAEALCSSPLPLSERLKRRVVP